MNRLLVVVVACSVSAVTGIVMAAPAFASTVPDPPTNVTASAGLNGVASVQWHAGSDGGSPLISFTVTAAPGGRTVTVGPTSPYEFDPSLFYAAIDGLTIGSTYTFTVVATNSIGDSSPSPPSDPVTMLASMLVNESPREGDVFTVGQAVYPQTEVLDASAVFMLQYYVDGQLICQREFDPFVCSDPQVTLDTSRIGMHKITYRMYDTQLNISNVTHSYFVVDPSAVGTDTRAPTVAISIPPEGASYVQGQIVDADYLCSDEPLGSGVDSCVGGAMNGAPIDTSTVGVHTFTVHATDLAGHSAMATRSYSVVGDGVGPTISISSPPQGAAYTLGQSVAASYSCADEVGGSGLASCIGDTPNNGPIDTFTAGMHSFTVHAVDNAGNATHTMVSYDVLAGSTTETVPAGGGTVTTDPGGLGPTEQVPVQTSVETSTGGTVAINEGSTTETPPASYVFLGQQITIDAPPAPDASHPLVLTFGLDASLHPDPSVIQIARDGMLLAACGPTHSNLPCVSIPSSIDANGDLSITVYTDHASTWNFAVHAPFTYSGFFQPVDNPQTLNSVKSGSAVPVRFSLGGNLGLAVLARGYPVSQRVACSSSAPIDAIEQTVNAGSSSLTFSSSTNQYTYVWKTDSAWAGTCRMFVLKLMDGTSHQAYFKFTK